MPPRPEDPRQLVVADAVARFRTMRGEDVEEVWGALRRLHERGELREEERVVPHCPHCVATAAGRDLVQRQALGASVVVRFPVVEDGGPLQRGDDVLVWTAAPWTLVANAAVAVHPERTYVRAKTAPLDPPVVLAESAVERMLGAAKVLERFPGAAIDGVRYEPPFPYLPAREHGERAHSLLLADSFTPDVDGTGLSPVAVAFGEDELRLGRRCGLQAVKPVLHDGTFDDRVGKYAGRPVAAAAADLVVDLRARRKLFRAEERERDTACCRWCGTAVLPYLKRAWFAHGEAVSRERAGGPPLPVWRCSEGHVHCAGSFAELEDLSAVRLADPGAPSAAHVSFPCPTCGRRATRVPAAADPRTVAALEGSTPAPEPDDLRRWRLLTGENGASVVERLREAATAVESRESAPHRNGTALHHNGAAAPSGGDAPLRAARSAAAGTITEHLSAGDAGAAARALGAVLDHLPDRRVAAGAEEARDSVIAAARLLAPFMPATAAEVHGRLTGQALVHLCAWPEARALERA